MITVTKKVGFCKPSMSPHCATICPMQVTFCLGYSAWRSPAVSPAFLPHIGMSVATETRAESHCWSLHVLQNQPYFSPHHLLRTSSHVAWVLTVRVYPPYLGRWLNELPLGLMIIS